MKIRLAKKIMKADTYADYPSKHPLPYWKVKFNEDYNKYGCVVLCSVMVRASVNTATSSTIVSKRQ